MEDKLEEIFSTSEIGEYDGNEMATDLSDGSLYMYGLNADRLFEIVIPILSETAFIKGAKAIKRYGSPNDGVKQTEIII